MPYVRWDREGEHMNYAETIAHETVALMERDPRVIVMGAGVTDEKGIFGTTKLAHERFPDRVIETPLSETMLTGALVGLAQNGWKPILVHARADFMTLSMEHLINTAAKWGYMGSDAPNLMVRCIIGQGWGNGPQHTQSTAHWFAADPGLRTLLPATIPALKRVYTDIEGPTVVFEHRRLYESEIKGDMSQYGDPDTADIQLVGLSATTLDCIEACALLRKRGINAEWASMSNPNASFPTLRRVVIADLNNQGLAADIGIRMMMNGIDSLIVRPPATPVPASYPLEQEWYPTPAHIANAALRLLGEESESVVGDIDEPFVPTGGPF